MKKHAILSIVSVILMSVMLVLFTKLVEKSKKDNYVFTNLISEIKEHNTSLNDSMLKSSMLLQKNYDLIVLHSEKVESAVKKLSLLSDHYGNEMKVLAKELQNHINEKLWAIETFKSKNATLKNSVTFFGTKLNALIVESTLHKNFSNKETILIVALDAANFLKSRDLASHTKLLSSLNLLKKKKNNEKINIITEALELHSQIILKSMMSSDLATRYSTLGKVRNILSNMDKLYQEKVKRSDEQSFFYQSIMLLITIFVYCYSLYIMIQLWQTMKHLEESNLRLESRVESRTKELNESNETIRFQQKSLIYSSKMSALGEMAGSVAHEINNPLAIITLSCKILNSIAKDKEIDRGFLTENVVAIESTVSRIAKIVKGLKTFSRNTNENEYYETSLKQILDETIALCQDKLKQNDVSLKLDLADADVFECNPIAVSQVLMNLIGNSCDAIEKLDHKWISITSRRTNNDLEIQITDSGKGISQEIIQKIMQPFFTTKDIGRGTGLGLSISKGIIESHNGELFYDSSQSNTSFVIRLPFRQKTLAAS